MKLTLGVLMILLGATILLWVAYNLLIERQPEFKGSPIPGVLFSLALVGGGIAMVRRKRAA